MNYKGVDYIEACKYLGLEVSEAEQQKIDLLEKVKSFIEWQFKNWDDMKEWKIINIYKFVDTENNIKYFKVKFKTPTTKGKEVRYYSIVDGKVQAKRNSEELPYNLFKVLKAISEHKPVFIVEGEKDADTLNHLGFVATSLKGCKEYINYFIGAIVYFIGDTGEAGEEYKNKIFKELKQSIRSFNVIDLTGIEKLGNNKDLTDWINLGHTKEQLIECIKDAWNILEYDKFKYYTITETKDEIIYKPMKIWENLNILLKRNKIQVKYNKLKKDIEFISDKIDRTLGNNATIESIYSICVKEGLMLSRESLCNGINRIAREYAYNPVREYLEEAYKNWDKVQGRMYAMCETVTQAEDFPNSIKHMLMTKWFVNTVRIAFNEGELNTEGVLVFQGKQGIYKTRWINSIIPNKEWLKTGMEIDPDNTDKVHQATSFWITELGELDATMKKDQAKLKAFFTEKQDLYRKPYERLPELYPRLTSFYSTVNVEEFLKDDTGNRRYWTIPVVELCVDHEIELDMFWGEVVHMWKTGAITHYLNQEEIELLNQSNSSFEQKDDMLIKIMDSFEWDYDAEFYEPMKPSDIGRWCNITNLTRLGTTLKKIMQKYPACEKKRLGGGYIYMMPPKCEKDGEPFESWEDLKEKRKYRVVK